MSYTFEINKYYDLYQNALHWIKGMLLYDKIRLKEIPQEIRFSNNIIYNGIKNKQWNFGKSFD